MSALSELLLTVESMKAKGHKTIAVEYVDNKLNQFINENMRMGGLKAVVGGLDGAGVSLQGREEKRPYEPRRPPRDDVLKMPTMLDHLEHASKARKVWEDLKKIKREVQT